MPAARSGAGCGARRHRCRPPVRRRTPRARSPRGRRSARGCSAEPRRSVRRDPRGPRPARSSCRAGRRAGCRAGRRARRCAPYDRSRRRATARSGPTCAPRPPAPPPHAGTCHDELVAAADVPQPDLQPGDERTALVQRLDQYRAIAAAALAGLRWEGASTHLLPATDLTVAGIVKHLAWAEDRWFQGRLLGVPMPAPWDAPGADDPDQAMRLASDDTVAGIVELYASACSRSRAALARCGSLDHVAAVPSFGVGPVNLRWILGHMADETAHHAGHLDLLRDCLTGG